MTERVCLPWLHGDHQETIQNLLNEQPGFPVVTQAETGDLPAGTTTLQVQGQQQTIADTPCCHLPLLY